MTDHDEILLLRQRFDDLERKLWELGSTVGTNRGQLRRHSVELVELRKALAGMKQADEIAAAVTDAIGKARTRRLTVAQKLAGAAVAVVLAVPAVHDLSAWAASSPPPPPASSSSSRPR